MQLFFRAKSGFNFHVLLCYNKVHIVLYKSGAKKKCLQKIFAFFFQMEVVTPV